METLRKEHKARTKCKKSRRRSPGSYSEKYRAGKFPEEVRFELRLEEWGPVRVQGLPTLAILPAWTV